MARLRPAHLPGGFYYVVLRGLRSSPIFLDDDDRVTFNRIVAQSLESCRARIHAYCWTASEARMAVQVSDIPLGQLVQRVTCQHARWVNRKRGQTGHLFQQGYRVIWLERQGHLRELVRHLHLVPVYTGLAQDPKDYVWSSHRAYLGLDKVPWLTTHVVLGMLPRRPRGQRVSYEEFIAQGLTQLDSASRDGALASGDHHFFSWLAKESSTHKEQYIRRILEAVSARLHVPLVDMLSNSHSHHISLARALVAWHITRNRLATLTEVAHRFRRHPSTLCVAVKRYRRGRPELFDEPLEELLRSLAPGAGAELGADELDGADELEEAEAAERLGLDLAPAELRSGTSSA